MHHAPSHGHGPSAVAVGPAFTGGASRAIETRITATACAKKLIYRQK
jgi:hypothetical protein